MHKIKQVFLILCLFTIGCDVPGVIELKNEINQVIVFTYSIKGKYKGIEEQVNEIHPKEKALIFLGFGARWNETLLTNYPLKVIDTIFVRINEKEYYCASQECKANIFNKRFRKSKRKLAIRIDSKLIRSSFTKNHEVHKS